MYEKCLGESKMPRKVWTYPWGARQDFLEGVVFNLGWFSPQCLQWDQYKHLGCTYWGQWELGREMLLASRGYRSGMLLDILQCPGQLPPQQTMVWPQMSVEPRLRNPSLNWDWKMDANWWCWGRDEVGEGAEYPGERVIWRRVWAMVENGVQVMVKWGRE